MKNKCTWWKTVPTWLETCVFLWWRQVFLSQAGTSPLNATEVYGSGVKLKCYCSSGSICTLKTKDEGFSDIIDVKGWRSKGNSKWKLFIHWFKVNAVFHLRFLVLSWFEGCSQNPLDWSSLLTNFCLLSLPTVLPCRNAGVRRSRHNIHLELFLCLSLGWQVTGGMGTGTQRAGNQREMKGLGFPGDSCACCSCRVSIKKAKVSDVVSLVTFSPSKFPVSLTW